MLHLYTRFLERLGLLLGLSLCSLACAESTTPREASPELDELPGSPDTPTTLDAQIAACRAQYPFGEEPEGATAAARTCQEDDGACGASNGMCQGTADGRECDPQAFVVTQAAAICIARAHGLEDGLVGPSAALLYNYGFRRVIWGISTVLYDRAQMPAAGSGASDSGVIRSGRADAIDAATGAVFEDGMTDWLIVE